MNKRSIENLVCDLDNKDVNMRVAAVKALGESQDPRAIEPLIGALSASKFEVRAAAAKALGNFKSPELVNKLLKMLAKDSDPGLPVAVGKALSYVGEIAIEPIVEALESGNDTARRSAARAFIYMKKKYARSAVGVLISALKDPDVRVRNEAAYSLGKIGDQRAVEPLVKALMEDRNASFLSTIIYSLGHIRDPRTEGLLIQALSMEDKYIRRAAVWALANIGGKRALEHLANALGDSWTGIQELAHKMILDIANVPPDKLSILDKALNGMKKKSLLEKRFNN